MCKSKNLFGFLLLLTGLALQGQNLGLVSINWNRFWLITPLLYGLYLFFKFYKSRDKETLIYATLFIGVGIVFLIPPYDLSWEEAMKWWPVCPFFGGLGIFFAYLMDKKDTNLLLTSAALTFTGGAFLASNFKWAQNYLKYWPILVIIFGIILIISNLTRFKKEIA
jgi:hypothetical protein